MASKKCIVCGLSTVPEHLLGTRHTNVSVCLDALVNRVKELERGLAPFAKVPKIISSITVAPEDLMLWSQSRSSSTEPQGQITLADCIQAADLITDERVIRDDAGSHHRG